MGARSKLKTRKANVMSNKGKRSGYIYYSCAVLGICIACLPLLVVATQIDEGLVVGAVGPFIEIDDLEAAESQHVGAAIPSQVAPVSVQTVPIPVMAPAPASVVPPAQAFVIPKTDLAGAPSYGPNPRYAVPPVNPYRERLPYEVANFRRRAQDDEDGPPAEDDYQPQESKGKKSSPGFFKRVTGTIKNAGKAVVGAPSFILKRYRGTWKKLFGGGKKKKGWKSWSSSSDKSSSDGGWGGWEESEPTGGWEPSHYPTDKGWKSSAKGWSDKGYSKGWESSNERRYDREQSSYRERDEDDYDHRPARPREKGRWNSSYKEETHYDEYDGRRTVANYGASRKPSSSRKPYSGSGSGGSYKYDDDY